MEIQYTIEPEANLIRVKVFGKVNSDDFIMNARTVYRDPLFKVGMNTLADFSEADFAPSFREAWLSKEFVKAIEEARGLCKWAVYDAGLPTARNCLSLYTTISEDVSIETRVFEKQEEAEMWVLESG